MKRVERTFILRRGRLNLPLSLELELSLTSSQGAIQFAGLDLVGTL